MNKEYFNKKIYRQKTYILLSILILILTGVVAVIINGLPANVCQKENFILHYIVMAFVLLLIPAAYITYMVMIRKSLKSEELERRFNTYIIAYNIRLLTLVIVGMFTGIAYIISPVKNYLLLLIAIILIILLFWPSVFRIKAELQIKDEVQEPENK
jgi:MFS family permease